MPNRYNNPQGRTDADEQLQYQRERSAENSGTVNGLLVGSLLVTLAGLGAMAVYYWSKPPAPVPTTIINPPPRPAASTAPAPQKQTTIIDRTVEKTVPASPALPPKVIEVPKPILVPGATKTIEVPKPVAVPATPSATDRVDPPKASPTPSTPPAPATSESPAPIKSPSPSNTEPGNT
jgi:hypothetical protein